MGKQQSKGLISRARWYDVYNSRIGQTYAGAEISLRGELARHSQQVRSPVVLRLSPRLTVISGPSGVRSTSESINQLITQDRPSQVVLVCPPDSSLAMQAVSEGSAADFATWLQSNPDGTESWRSHTNSGHACSMSDIHLNNDAQAMVLQGPLSQQSWSCRRSDSRVVAWDYDAGVASEAVTAIRSLFHSNHAGSVLLADIPIWMQLLHVASSHSHAQMARLVHALHSGKGAADPTRQHGPSAPGAAAVTALLAPALRMSPCMLSPDMEALSALLPLLAAARHRAVATTMRHAELQGRGHTLAVVPPVHLHGVRFAYSQLADAQQAAVGADDLLASPHGLRALHDLAMERLQPRAVTRGGDLDSIDSSTPSAHRTDALQAVPRLLHISNREGDLLASCPPRPAPAADGIAHWMQSKSSQGAASVLRSTAGVSQVRPPRGGEGGVLQVLPDPLSQAALLASPIPAVLSSMLPGGLSDRSDDEPVVGWLGDLHEQLLGVAAATASPQAASASLGKLAWLNAVVHKPAPWGGLVHGHALDAMAWGVGRTQSPAAPLDQAAGRTAAAAHGTGEAGIQAAHQQYTAAHGEMTQWLRYSPPLDLSRPERGGICLPASTQAVMDKGGFLPLRHALIAFLQAQDADAGVGDDQETRGVYFKGG